LPNVSIAVAGKVAAEDPQKNGSGPRCAFWLRADAIAAIGATRIPDYRGLGPAPQFRPSPFRRPRCSSSIATRMRRQTAEPSASPSSEQLIGPPSRAESRLFAVMVDEQLGGAPDVRVLDCPYQAASIRLDAARIFIFFGSLNRVFAKGPTD
jgi:hypothetical protein